jgi:hypothetical protein
MSDLDQRLLDGIRLTSDAYAAGQLDALRELRDLLESALAGPAGRIAASADPVERARARGAREAVEQTLHDVEARIESVESKRAG